MAIKQQRTLIHKVMYLRIKEICKEKGVTISRLAALVGITQPNMSNIANQKTAPSLELVGKIAAALGVRVSELFEAPSSQPAGQTIIGHNVIGNNNSGSNGSIGNRQYYGNAANEVWQAKAEMLKERITEKDDQIERLNRIIAEKDAQIQSLLSILEKR